MRFNAAGFSPALLMAIAPLASAQSRDVAAVDPTGSAAQGDYAGKLANRNYILKVNRKAESLTRVSRNGAPMAKLESKAALDSAAQGWFNDTANATVGVKFRSATAIPVKIVLME